MIRVIQIFVIRLVLICLFASQMSIDAICQLENSKEELGNSMSKKLNSAPAVFRENKGQWEDEILFRTQIGNTNIHFTESGLSFGLRKIHENKQDLASDANMMSGQGHKNAKFEFLIWDLNYVNGNKNTTWSKNEGVKSYTNYYKGADGGNNPQINVVDYKNITNYNVYDQIDVDYYVSKEKLKYDYILHPGADIEDVQLQFNGVEGLEIDGEGNLKIQTRWGKYTKTIPYSYQIINGEEVEVKVDFALSEDALTYGFEVSGEYNKKFDLVIDPIYIDWGTFFYGEKTGSNRGYHGVLGVELDSSSNAIICGWTVDKFPAKPGWYDTSLSGVYDGFVCKMKSDGSDVLWFSYIGGSHTQRVVSISVSDNGTIYGTGITTSKDFPTTNGAFQTKPILYGNIFQPSFVFGIKSDGTGLVYSSYLNFGEFVGQSWGGQPIVVNDKNEVYVGLGYKKDTSLKLLNYILPKGYYDTKVAGATGLIIKLNSSGSALLKSTLHGGSGMDEIYGLYLDKEENLFIAGNTSSSNMWVTSGIGGFGKNYYGGSKDGFIAKIDSSFSKYLISKYVGGNAEDKVKAMHGTSDGIFVLLETNSSSLIGVNNPNGGGVKKDVGVLKIWNDGLKADWVSIFGGNENEFPRDIVVNIKGEAIIIGESSSNNYPTTKNGLKSSVIGVAPWRNGILTKLDNDGNIIYSSYLGGSEQDDLWAIATKRVGCVSQILIGGVSESRDFPISKGSYKDTFNNHFWGVVLKLNDTLKLDEIALGDTIIECNQIAMKLNAGNIGASYIWSTGDTTRRITARDTGTFWVQATYGCGTEIGTIHIDLEHTAKRTLLEDTVYCGSFLDTLDAINDTIPFISYEWNTGEKTRTIIVDQPGTYEVALNTKNCGLVKDAITIGLKDFPEIVLPKDSTFCDTFSVVLDAGNANKEMSYLWNTSSLDTTQMITARDTGLYTVIVSGYCGADTASILFEYDTIPYFELPSDSIFCDTVDYLISSLDYSKNTEISYSTNLIGLEQNDNKSFLLNDTGYYWLELNNLCGMHREDIRIDKILSPTVNLIDKDTMCNTDVLLMTVGQSNNEEIYEWLPGGSNMNNHLINSPGVYKVKISNKCATVMDSIDVAYLLDPEVDLGKDSLFCDVAIYTLDAGNLDREEEYMWNDGSSNQTIGINGEGTHWVVVSNKCGSDSDTINFRYLETPVVDLGADKAFCGSTFAPFELDALNENKQVTYEWSTNASTQKIMATLPGIYAVKVSNECGEANSSMEVELTPYPVVDLGIDTSFCGYFSYFVDAGNPGSTYSWSPSGDNTQQVELVEYGLHKVVVNNNNCISEDEIFIDQKCNTLFFMPNSFTPNGNGLNEVLKPTMHHVFEMTYSIYNRWGELIFQTTDLDGGWDGKFNGVDCPQGVYLWSISYLGEHKVENPRGYVILKR